MKFKDSISLNVTSRRENENKSRILIYITNILISFIGLISTSFIIISVCSIEYSLRRLVVFCILLCVLNYLIYLKSKLFKYKVIMYLITLLITIYMYRVEFYYGIYHLVGKLLEAIKLMRLSNIDITEQYKFFAIGLIINLISIIYTISITYRISSIIVVAFPSLLLIVGLCTEELYSNKIGIILFSFLVAIISMEIYSTDKALKGIVGITVLLLVFSSLIVTTFIYSEKDYSRIDAIENIKYSLLNSDLNKKIFNMNSDIATGGISDGNLGKVDSLEYKNKIDLEVILPSDLLYKKGYDTYLKAFVGGTYTGGSWKAINENNNIYGLNKLNKNNDKLTGYNYFNIYSQLGSSDLFGMDISKVSINIKNIDANRRYMYVPYNSDAYSNSNIKVDSNNYECSYYAYNSDELFEKLDIDMLNKYLYIVNGEIDDNYKEYVYKNYLQLPNNTLGKIKSKYKDYYKESNYNLNQCVDEVKRAVTKNTKYSLDPGKLPEGKDFVEYFLYENKKGYCSHFASAGTVIFRAMGIPARYVEGYAIKSENYLEGELNKRDIVTNYYKQITSENIKVVSEENVEYYSKVYVKDSDAHAWIEIYIDGMGWQPIDITPSTQSTYVEASEENSLDEKIDNIDICSSYIIDEEEFSDNFISINFNIINEILRFIYLLPIIIMLTFICRYKILLYKRKYQSSKEQCINILNKLSYIDKKVNYINSEEGLYREFDCKEFEFIKKDQILIFINILFKIRYGNEEINIEDNNKIILFNEYISLEIYKRLNILKKIKFKYIKGYI